MSAIFKVQKIRSCQQCFKILPIKCESCVCNPNRKPSTIEVYDWPEILEVGPCKCVRIACQRPGCLNPVWRSRSHNRGGLSKFKSLYCSPKCNITVLSASRRTKVSIPCGWCKKPVERKASVAARVKNAFCHREHYHLFYAKEGYMARQNARHPKRAEFVDDSVQMLQCRGICRDVTEHKKISQDTYACGKCRVRRSATLKINSDLGSGVISVRTRELQARGV